MIVVVDSSVWIALLRGQGTERVCRLGVTLRKTIGLIVGTFCLDRGYALPHADRDFEPMVAHLGLPLA